LAWNGIGDPVVALAFDIAAAWRLKQAEIESIALAQKQREQESPYDWTGRDNRKVVTDTQIW
jgi:hypothetical protein